MFSFRCSTWLSYTVMVFLIALIIPIITATSSLASVIIIDVPALEGEAAELGNEGVGAGDPERYGNTHAQSFTLPSGQDYLLGSVTLMLGRYPDRDSDGKLDCNLSKRSFDIYLYADTDGAPGSRVGVISANNSYADITSPVEPWSDFIWGDYTYVAQSPLLLNAEDTYWVVVAMKDIGFPELEENESDFGYPTALLWHTGNETQSSGLAASEGVVRSYCTGDDWGKDPGAKDVSELTWNENAGNLRLMVTGVAVPEPATWGAVMALCGLGAALGSRLRRRAKEHLFAK